MFSKRKSSNFTIFSLCLALLYQQLLILKKASSEEEIVPTQLHCFPPKLIVAFRSTSISEVENSTQVFCSLQRTISNLSS